MANLKNIKNRITGIKNTQKITRAMQMVASAKVKKTENANPVFKDSSSSVKEQNNEYFGF